jgi:hypothetical protein
LAAVFAQELAAQPAYLWAGRSLGSIMSVTVYIDDDPEIADVVATAFEVARTAPSRDQVWSQRGEAGVVVVAHGPTWSVVARSGGPILLLAEQYTQVLRVDTDPGWQVELTAMVAELILAAEGRDPVAELPELPAPPPVPRNRGDSGE